MYASCDRCVAVSDRADPKHSGHLDKFKAIADLKDATGEARDQDKLRLFCRNQGIGPLDPGEQMRADDKKEKPAGKCYHRRSYDENLQIRFMNARQSLQWFC